MDVWRPMSCLGSQCRVYISSTCVFVPPLIDNSNSSYYFWFASAVVLKSNQVGAQQLRRHLLWVELLWNAPLQPCPFNALMCSEMRTFVLLGMRGSSPSTKQRNRRTFKAWLAAVTSGVLGQLLIGPCGSVTFFVWQREKGGGVLAVIFKRVTSVWACEGLCAHRGASASLLLCVGCSIPTLASEN